MGHATTVDLIRHADVRNPADVFYGRLPRFGLSELGRRQAIALAAIVAHEPVDCIYTSPLLRARQTARLLALAHPGAPLVRVSRALIEVGSHWQGRPTTELEAIGFDFFALADDGDESIVDVYARMERFIRTLIRHHPGGRVLCISHADPIMIARTGMLNRPLVVASLRNQPDYPAKVSISRLEFDGPNASPTFCYIEPPTVV